MIGLDVHQGNGTHVIFAGEARADFVVSLAGGYGANIDETVQAHVNTVRIVATFT